MRTPLISTPWPRISAAAPLICAILQAGSFPSAAQSYTWVPTGAGTFNWNVAENWNPATGYPDGTGQTASIIGDITAAQTINLLGDRTLGRLNLGDADGSHGLTIASGAGTNRLIFDSGVEGLAARLDLQGANGAGVNAISAGVILNSDLLVTMGAVLPDNSARLNFSGTVALGDRSITFSGGTVGAGNEGISFSALSGSVDSVITNNSTFTMRAPGNNSSFLGTIVLNGRATGSNTSTLGLGATGSIVNAKEVVINGYLTGGVTQMGGGLVSGDGLQLAANPGQRLTQNTITLNGGSLTANGQPLQASVVDRLVKNQVATFRVNSGYSLLTIGSSTMNGGSQAAFDVSDLQRQAGASLFVRASLFDSPAASNATFFRFDNSGSYLVGSGGGADTTTRSIIPWMLVDNTNPNASAGGSFATYDASGVRALRASEYSGSITAGADHNVSVGGFTALAADATVNSLRLTTNTTNNIGADRVLTIQSGALLFTANNATLGGSGSATAGTVSFGSREGVIWSNATNVNTIGASLAGSGGLTKAGTGTLILTGGNSYAGVTHVGSGILQVGDGTRQSNLGAGDVVVAAGALLDVRNDNALSEDYVLRMTLSGLVHGMVLLGAGTENTVAGLYFGDVAQAAGTWGSSASGAEFVNDIYFSGTGILIVVPEPAAGLLVLGGVALVGLSRRIRRVTP